MKLLKYIKLVYHSIRLLLNPDGNIKSLIFLGDRITESKVSKKIVDDLFENQDLQNMYNEKKGLDPFDLVSLSSMPIGSLGYSLYKFYSDQNLDVYPMGRFNKYTRSRYVGERTRNNHDILHLILEYGTDLIGEAKVNAYVFNQTRMPIPFLILVGIGLKFLVKQPLQFRTLINEIETGWKMGYRTDFFLTQDWKGLMKLPLDDVRDLFIKKAIILSGKEDSISKNVA